MATIICPEHRPQMATVRSGVMEALEKDTARNGVIETIEVEFDEKDLKIKIREIVKSKHQVTDICDSKILISVGRGIGGKEGLIEIKKLAKSLDGEVSSSRSVVDSGWLPKDRQVGQTGKTVRPSLYLACGISGAIQHVAGMEGSKYIIAINKNETAPIFEVADLGIVGDLKSIIPKLNDRVKKIREEN